MKSQSVSLLSGGEFHLVIYSILLLLKVKNRSAFYNFLTCDFLYILFRNMNKIVEVSL